MMRLPLVTVSWERPIELSIPNDEFGTALTVFDDRKTALIANVSHYGFVERGPVVLRCESGTFSLKSGMYFSVCGPADLEGSGRGIVVARPDYRCLFSLGGPCENQGRLQYVDGCTDTLLLGPPKVGGPCLNLLYLPPHTQQRRHTHPSVRVGVIISGRGRCVGPGGSVPLAPGQIFVIPPHTEHSFFTDDDPLRVIAYHPDTDTGPSDHDHPMINRTIVSHSSELGVGNAVRFEP